MKKGLKRGFVALWIAVFLLSAIGPCYAQEPFTKLGRGVANALTGWAEVPKNVYETSVQHNAFVGLTLGLVKGAGMTLVRTAAGIYEVATFPFPWPDDYVPVLEPEYVF